MCVARQQIFWLQEDTEVLQRISAFELSPTIVLPTLKCLGRLDSGRHREKADLLLALYQSYLSNADSGATDGTGVLSAAQLQGSCDMSLPSVPEAATHFQKDASESELLTLSTAGHSECQVRCASDGVVCTEGREAENQDIAVDASVCAEKAQEMYGCAGMSAAHLPEMAIGKSSAVRHESGESLTSQQATAEVYLEMQILCTPLILRSKMMVMRCVHPVFIALLVAMGSI